MVSKSSATKDSSIKSGMVNDQASKVRVLIPTKCKESTIHEIFSFLKLLKGNINVDFLHIVPVTPEELCDCVDDNDLHYDRAVAEKKLYSFVKRFPKVENVSYSYRVEEGDPKRAIEKITGESEYDILALEIGEFCHFANSVFDVTEIISSVRIPVVTFRGPIEAGKVRIGGARSMSEVTA
ncbi:MAG: hypothetical protein QXO03_04600 [Thermoplasmatales archaeon]